MSDINTELSDGILRVELNRPDKKNAMTGAMYARLAEILAAADRDDAVRIVLWHGAGGAFTAGNDIEDFLSNPPAPGGSPHGFVRLGDGSQVHDALGQLHQHHAHVLGDGEQHLAQLLRIHARGGELG